ncbi:hypothetical protein SteCoe_36732 [Stentor coeruleus]|uniref:Uncharacterized protein n=1 Tax=Stentor coeruleus TaxID=5963 RepID=A0A1R2APU4_9CILI|nr:hypothetical protein SteCoe_36732 [Stentor coeruleus]
MQDQATNPMLKLNETSTKSSGTLVSSSQKLTEADKEDLRKEKMQKIKNHPAYLNLQEGSQVLFSFLTSNYNYYNQSVTLPAPANISSTFLDEDDFIQHLCRGRLQQEYKLLIEYNIYSPLLKNRFFSVRAGIANNQNDAVILDNPMQFTAALYADEIPLRQLINTRHNEKIMTGTTVVETSEKIYFRKLAIKEVSSYYKTGIFHLAIIPEDLSRIKPFVIMNIKVKSRYEKMWQLQKKIKLDE